MQLKVKEVGAGKVAAISTKVKMTGSSGKMRNYHIFSTFQHRLMSVNGVHFTIHTFTFNQYIHENRILLCVYTLCKGCICCEVLQESHHLTVSSQHICFE